MNYRSQIADIVSVGVTAIMLVLQVLGLMMYLDIETAKEVLHNNIIAIAVSRSLFEVVMILLFVGIIEMLWRPSRKGLLETTNLIICSLFPLLIAVGAPMVQLKITLQHKHQTMS